MQSVLAQFGDAKHGLDLEITENLLMEDIHANITKLDACRNMGMRIAVDDFGTGYSSLAYVARLPVHSMKIDRSFIASMIRNVDDAKIVSAIISPAHSLNLGVVAERRGNRRTGESPEVAALRRGAGISVQSPVVHQTTRQDAVHLNPEDLLTERPFLWSWRDLHHDPDVFKPFRILLEC